jgi:hypothetical protein
MAALCLLTLLGGRKGIVRTFGPRLQYACVLAVCRGDLSEGLNDDWGLAGELTISKR